MRIVFRARALRHLREIEHHIGQDNPKAAARVIVRLESAINTLPIIPFPPLPGLYAEHASSLFPVAPTLWSISSETMKSPSSPCSMPRGTFVPDPRPDWP